MRTYTDKELIDKIKLADGFLTIPFGCFLVGVRSNADALNEFDDKMYLFERIKNGVRCIKVTTCTTNSGPEGLLNFSKYNSKGVAVLKSNQWYYNFWAFGLHKGKMPALKQVRDAIVFRDGNKNKKNEEIGTPEVGLFGINFHTTTYNGLKGFVSKFIGGWSVGCQVLNNYDDYLFILDKVKSQKLVTYVLLTE